MRRCLYSPSVGWLGSLGLLLLRLVMGTAFVLHGWPKIQNPLGWMGSGAAIPAVFLALAAVAEFGGGIGLILGALTRIASLGIAAVMVVAIAMVHLPQGHTFVGAKGGSSYELAAVYLVCAVLVLLTGAGKFSVDAFVFGRPRKAEAA